MEFEIPSGWQKKQAMPSALTAEKFVTEQRASAMPAMHAIVRQSFLFVPVIIRR